jgi:hypothetical protein
VDFLVDDSAWLKMESGLVVMRAGLPVQAHGVPIDTLSIRDEERHLVAALEAPEVTEGVPVAPVEAEVFLKLVSPRAKDWADVIELLKAGLDPESARRYLQSCAPALVGRFDEAVKAAKAEEED